LKGWAVGTNWLSISLLCCAIRSGCQFAHSAGLTDIKRVDVNKPSTALLLLNCGRKDSLLEALSASRLFFGHWSVAQSRGVAGTVSVRQTCLLFPDSLEASSS